MQTSTARVLFRPPHANQRYLPEGPYPCAAGRLSWVSIQHGEHETVGSLNILDLASGENINYPLPGRPGFAFPTDQPDTFVIGLERRVVAFHLRQGEVAEICSGVDADVAGTIINDGCVYGGNLIFGTKDLKFQEKKAGLYLWRAADRRLIRLRDDQICSNGKIVLAGDMGLELFDIDSPTRKIVAYPLDIDAGTIGPPRVVVDLTGEPAVPDGMVETADGQSLIVAMFHPGDPDQGEIRQYRIDDGQLEFIWRCENAPRVTCPQLVEHAGRVCIIATTAVEGMPEEQLARRSNSGSLFIAETTLPAAPNQPIFPLP